MSNTSDRQVPGKPVILSVRHGESVTNVYRALHSRISDPAVFLTERGHQQARDAAAFITESFRSMPAIIRPKKVRIMRSFYTRAMQTAEPIHDALVAADLGIEISMKEDPRLRELEFGYVGALKEPLHYVEWLSNILRFQGYKYLATRFGGESPASMEPRVRSVLDAIFRDFTENGITHFIVVNHGLTSRVLTRVRYGLPNSWYEQEANPDNCAIRLMSDTDQGYIFPNARGQWDPDWQREPADAGNPKLNPGGLFFSPEEIGRMIETQKERPDLLAELDQMFREYPNIPASKALEGVLGIPE